MSAWAEARRLAPDLDEAGIEDAAFEAEYLARAASGMSRAEYFAGRALDDESRSRLADAIRRRLAREPAAYITGHREFFGNNFAVDRSVLIPRPETELLVEAAIVAARPGDQVVDVGTGSGCIAVSVAVGSPGVSVLGVDISAAAVTVARRNARQHDAAVDFAVGDLLSPVARGDVVTANLPYIPSSEIERLQPEVREWEPRLALDGSDDGLALIRRVVAECGSRLRPRLLALEVAAGQAPSVARLIVDAGGTVTVRRDLAGIERMVCGSWA